MGGTLDVVHFGGLSRAIPGTASTEAFMHAEIARSISLASTDAASAPLDCRAPFGALGDNPFFGGRWWHIEYSFVDIVTIPARPHRTRATTPP
jgi:hypothetical protein